MNICRTVCPSLAASFEPLAYRRNAASLSIFYRFYVARSSSELAQLFPFPYLRERFTRYSDRLQKNFVTIPICARMSMSTVSFLATLDSGILLL